jgi:hypothetical protein
VFNWRGQYENTKAKLEQLKSVDTKVTVINSDEAHNDEGWVNVGEDAYFNAQMMKAIELFDGDVLAHIQADASYDDWNKLYADAEKYLIKYNAGIYAPNVDYTWYTAERTDVPTLSTNDAGIKPVGCPDCTCWFIQKWVINEFKNSKIDMSPYKMGWGWDLLFPAFSYLRGFPVLRDYNHTIQHPRGTNYNKEQAEIEMHNLFITVPQQIHEAMYYVKFDRNKLANFFMQEHH